VIDIPDVVRSKATAVGAQGWLDDLGPLVDSIERDWDLRIGRVFSDATEALVAEATMQDGSVAVVKLIMPRDFDAARHEITVLHLANGEGCALLLRCDEARGALLLERLGPSLHDLALPLARRLEILVAAASKVWRPAGDVHEWNALRAKNGYKLVDPDGLLAEAEYDLGVLMREDPVDLLAGDPFERARWLAARSGLDSTAIWEWGVVERVSTGLLCIRVELQPVGRQMLAAADFVAATTDGARCTD
jgi:streptomycin 6-kinase